jgi:hypothetical protein
MPNTRRFGFTSTFNDVTPVTLPPGRLKAGDERDRHRINPCFKDDRDRRGGRFRS